MSAGMSGSRRGLRLALAGLFLAWLLGVSIGPALAASPAPSAGSDYGGDTRTSGQGPGLVGSPLYALGGVLVVALISIGITLVYVRATSGPERPSLAREGRWRRQGLARVLAAACSSSAPTTATSTASTRARARQRWRTDGLGKLRRLRAGARSTRRRRSPTGASTSARPTARSTRSSPRPARSRWTRRTGGYVYAGPAVVHQAILDRLLRRLVLCLRRRARARGAGASRRARRISGSATVVDDIVYFSTFGNGTFGLDVGSGRQVWRRLEGRYSPVVATRDAFYFVGYSTLRRLRSAGHAAGTHLRTDGTVISRGARARSVEG